MNIIAIDCGSSFIKGALFDNRILIRQLHESAPTVDIHSNILDPSHIEALIQIVHKMITSLSSGLEEAVLCISNEMHGFILAYEDGRPFTDYISWQRELNTNRKNIGGGVLTFVAILVCRYAQAFLHAISHG